jgi:hypothetical protein
VTEVPIAVRFWRRLDAMMAQGQELLRTFRQLLETQIFHRTTLRFVAAGTRRRIDAVLRHTEVVVRTICQLLGSLSPRKKTLALVVAGVVGLALLLLLLEISVRTELAKEANDAAIAVTLAPTASAQKMEFGDAVSNQPTGSMLSQSVDQSGATGATSSSDDAQTFGQGFSEPVPLPRSRKSR